MLEDNWETYNDDEIILPNISKLQEENNLKRLKERQLVEDSDHLLTNELFLNTNTNTNTNTKFVKKEEQKEEQKTFQKEKDKIKPKFVKTQNKEKEKQKEKEKLNKIKKKQKDEIFGEAESIDYLQETYCDLEDKY